MRTVPDLHIKLLDDEIADLEPDCLRHVMDVYPTMRAGLKPTGAALIDRLFAQADEAFALLKKPDALYETQRNTLVAAMRYFIKTNDGVPDDFGKAGLTDDALVMQAAVNRMPEKFSEGVR